jgi:hypothetical protein
VELNGRYARTAARRVKGAEPRQLVIRGDAREIRGAALWRGRREELEALGLAFERGRPQFDFAITSPPYWRMLRTSRGGVFSKQKQRAARGLDTAYSRGRADLGNVADYGEFVEALGKVFDRLKSCVRDGRYLVVVAQNLRDAEGEIKPLAWDLTRRIGRSGRGASRWQFQGERIWCQNTKPLGIWGYPKVFVPNYHHHYCLIFRKVRGCG